MLSELSAYRSRVQVCRSLISQEQEGGCKQQQGGALKSELVTWRSLILFFKRTQFNSHSHAHNSEAPVRRDRHADRDRAENSINSLNAVIPVPSTKETPIRMHPVI